MKLWDGATTSAMAYVHNPVLREVVATIVAKMESGAYDNAGPRVSLAELERRDSSASQLTIQTP